MKTTSFAKFLRRCAALAAAMLALGQPAGAITLENYQKYRLDTRNVSATFKSLLEVRMEGVLQGLMIANRAAEAAGAKPLFCPPANLQMRGTEVLKMLDTELISGVGPDGKPYPGNTVIENVLFALAQKRWPCTR
jgi:hypothetical protein